MPQVWEWGRKTPAFFAFVAEGALLSHLDGGDVDLEAWPAQSSERLSHAVWPTRVRSTDCVVALNDSRTNATGLGWDSWADSGSSASYAESQVLWACFPIPRPLQTWSLPWKPPGLPPSLTFLRVIKIELSHMSIWLTFSELGLNRPTLT